MTQNNAIGMVKANKTKKKCSDLPRGAIPMISMRSGVPIPTLRSVLYGVRGNEKAKTAIVDFCTLNKLPIPQKLTINSLTA